MAERLLDNKGFRAGFEEAREDEPVGSSGLAFVVFLVVTAILFIRPSELVPDLQGAPIFELAMAFCLLLSFGPLKARLRPLEIIKKPTVFFVIAMVPAVAISHLARGDLYQTRTKTVEFAKVLAYYLLLTSILTTAWRIRFFVALVFALVTMIAALAILEYHGLIDLPSLAPLDERVGSDPYTGESQIAVRLMATGIFSDPNDFSLVLGAAVLLGGRLLLEARNVIFRVVFVSSLALLIYALVLTRSRGGFIAFVSGISVLIVSRFGWRRAFPIAIVALPVLAVVFDGRQLAMNISDKNDTAQGRIELWRDAIGQFRRSPVSGVGVGELQDIIGQVAHNSFVQAFAEMGIIGGTCFFGFVAIPIYDVWKIQKKPNEASDASLFRWTPHILAALTAYAVGMFSLARCYTVSTYLVFGVGAAFTEFAARNHRDDHGKVSLKIIAVVACGSVALLAVFYLVTQFFS